MKRGAIAVGAAFLAALVILLPGPVFLGAQQTSPATQPAPTETKAATTAPAEAAAPAGQEVTAGPRNPKEQMGLYVFMAWLWVAIIVLVFILRAKVREVDRLFEARYLTGEKHGHSG